MNLSGNKILITGGASGIGAGLSERFLAEQNTVIVCGRREEVLNDFRMKYPQAITYCCDLALKEDREALFRFISKEHSDLNVLINNAGIQNWMKVSDEDFLTKAESEMSINMMAPVHLTHQFLKLSKLNTIINVTSGLSFVPMVKVPVYCATKAFFHSFTLTLRAALQTRGIEVIELIPPAINTDLGGKGLHDFAPPVNELIDAVFVQLKEGRTELTFGMSAQLATAGPEQQKEIFRRMNAQ